MIRLREGVGRRRRKLIAVAALAALVAILAWEHSAHGLHEMDDDAIAALTTCVAVLDSAALGLLAVAAARRRRGIGSPPATTIPKAPRVGLPDLLPASRAGPALLQSFRC